MDKEKHRYRVIFRSNWKFELEALRRSWKYSSKKVKIFVYASFPLLAILAVLLVLHNIQRHDYILAIFWILYPFVPILHLIARLKPKTYETSLRGLIIDGQLHRWKNYKGYFADGEMLYLINWTGGVIVLPQRFEDVIKEFVPKLPNL